jgi:hypothetical protein
MQLSDRHPSVQQAARWLLEPNPNLAGTQYAIVQQFKQLTENLLGALGDGPQLVLGLHDLTRAKDALVRQAIDD